MFCACFFLFFCQLTFSDVRQPTFSKLFHMTWLQPHRKRCCADFLKVPPNKKGAKTPKYRLILRLTATTYLTPSLVMWKESRKSKTIVNHGLLAYIFTKFGRGRLNSGGDRRARLYTGLGKFVRISNCHGHSCTRRAIFTLGIDTLIANILVIFAFGVIVVIHRARWTVVASAF